jgi:hypothetical protein
VNLTGTYAARERSSNLGPGLAENVAELDELSILWFCPVVSVSVLVGRGRHVVMMLWLSCRAARGGVESHRGMEMMM